jgi:hypothetical protein
MIELTLLGLLLIVVVGYLFYNPTRSYLAIRRAQQAVAAAELLAQRLDRYRLVNFEQVQDTWLVYDSVSGEFLGQCPSVPKVVEMVRDTWPDKVVLGLNKTDQDVYLISAPPGVARPDEQPIIGLDR